MVIKKARKLINLDNYCALYIYELNPCKFEILADRTNSGRADSIAILETEEQAMKILEAISIAWDDKDINTFHLDKNTYNKLYHVTDEPESEFMCAKCRQKKKARKKCRNN